MSRKSDHPVNDMFLNRWSPRAFDGSDMPSSDLKTILEAARWAPSAFNVQPWRFVYALRNEAAWEKLVGLLDDFNQSWAHRASALVFLFSDTLVDGVSSDGPVQSQFHTFDAGSAWAQAALQATALGYHAHGMAGLRRTDLHEVLNVPGRFKAEIAFAVGRQAAADILPENLQEKETPSGRKPLEEIAFAGSFGA